MATVMAEMYNMGDSDHNEKLDRNEFIRVSLYLILLTPQLQQPPKVNNVQPQSHLLGQNHESATTKFVKI